MSTQQRDETVRDQPNPKDDRLVDALAQLSFVVQRELTEVAAAHDLSLTQLRLLGIVVDRTVAMAELATYLGLDRSSVTGLVERAERRDLVRREPRPGDGRGVQVRISAAGRRLAGDLRTALTPTMLALADKLTVRERTTLTALVVTMLDRG